MCKVENAYEALLGNHILKRKYWNVGLSANGNIQNLLLITYKL